MNIEAFSRSKYKDMGKPGDDVIFIEPDGVLAVFDGATDPTGAFYNGESSGRIAARSAARRAAQLAASGMLLEAPGREIFQALSDSVRDAAIVHSIAHPPSTTAAIVAIAPDHYRLLALGDTGIRLNGKDIYQHHKLIDVVSTAARVAVHGFISRKIADPDIAEMTTRKVIFNGLDAAVSGGQITASEADDAIAAAVSAANVTRDVAGEFLGGGIKTQFHRANAEGPLGFASINGKGIILEGTTDLRIPREQVRSIEIFSDGYVSIPESGVEIADWEREFERAERVDFHKTSAFPAVKGSTSLESCDDRTVISAISGRGY